MIMLILSSLIDITIHGKSVSTKGYLDLKRVENSLHFVLGVHPESELRCLEWHGGSIDDSSVKGTK